MDINAKPTESSARLKRPNQFPQKIGKTKAIQSVFRTAQILHCLAGNINALTDIAEYCNLSTTTVHRFLQSLEESELAFQDPIEHKYHLGPLFTELLVTQINVHTYLIDRSNQEINRLSRLFGESIALDVEAGLQIVTLVHIPTRFNYGIVNPMRLPFYSSVSQAMLSQRSDDEIDKILNHLKSLPGDRAVDKENLKKQIIEGKRLGYNIFCEDPDGITGISVPIRNYLCPAALSVAGPEMRMSSIKNDVIIELKTSAAQIENSLLKSEKRK
jgi:DNA-binding IclR family transcriptional regulator